jgi:DNA polymerase III epsilon subunit-like protein
VTDICGKAVIAMSETRRVMIDIETVGLERGAAIVEIGAVQFTPDGGCHDRIVKSDTEDDDFER